MGTPDPPSLLAAVAERYPALLARKRHAPFEIYYVGTDVVAQRNAITQPSPVWTPRGHALLLSAALPLLRERGLILIPSERGWTATPATVHPHTERVGLPDVGTLMPAPDPLTAVLHALMAP